MSGGAGDDQVTPLGPDDPGAIELERLLDGRPDPSSNTAPPGEGPPVDALKVLDGQEQLDRMG